MDASQSARQLLNARDTRRASRSEYGGQRIDAGPAHAEVVHGDAGLSRFLDGVRRVGPGVAAFVAVIRDQAVADHDEQAPLRGLSEQATRHMTERRAESRVPTGGESDRARYYRTTIPEVPQARHL